MTNYNPEPIRLTKAEMQEYFNEYIMPLLTSGELEFTLLSQRHANPEKSGQVLCTYSQMLAIVDKNENHVAKVHQYLLPNKTLGASKLPDPVRIEWEGKTYKLKRKTD